MPTTDTGLKNDPQRSPPRQFRNLHVTQIATYRLPLAGWVSILHRVSGLFLFLMLPLILYVLHMSLTSAESFDAFKAMTTGFYAKLIILALSWAYLHHFCAGLRHLLMDNHMGLSKEASRRSAATVLVISGLLTFGIAVKLFGLL